MMEIKNPNHFFAFLRQKGISSLIVLIVLVGILLLVKPESMSLSSISSLMDQASILLLLASAQCIIIIMGRIDLANATFCSLLTVITALSLNSFGFLAIPVLIVFAIFVGFLQSWLHQIFQVPSFVISLAFLGIASGCALVLTSASTILVKPNVRFTKVLFSSPGDIPISFMLSLFIVGILGFLLAKTPWGRAVRAIGFNQRASTYSGINTFWVMSSAFMVATTLIAIASTLNVGYLGTASASIADSYLLPGIAAVVVGGTSIAGGIGGIGRTVWGVLIISVLRIGMDLLHISQNVQPVVYGIIIILAIALTVDRSRVSIVA
jgi:ribose transport system permease protein